jgi:beta-lactamase class D
LILLLLMSGPVLQPIGAAEERADWHRVFDELGAVGTIVVVDERGGERSAWVHDSERAQQQFSPASTFKIPHTLFALDAGIVSDEFQVFEWDGVERSFSAHNQDQDLRSAMRNSAIWVYQDFARAIGEERTLDYLRKAGYGEMAPSFGEGDYWVNGSLTLSAHEQIEFLRRLYRNELPFQTEHQRLVKDLIVVEAGYTWILRAKTGWDGQIGWWVGWVEWPAGPVFFALNIDTPNRLQDLALRQQLGRAILHTLDALPDS